VARSIPRVGSLEPASNRAAQMNDRHPQGYRTRLTDSLRPDARVRMAFRISLCSRESKRAAVQQEHATILREDSAIPRTITLASINRLQFSASTRPSSRTYCQPAGTLDAVTRAMRT